MSSEVSSEVLSKPLSKMSIFSSLDRSGLREYFNSSKISLEIPEEVLALRKLKYQNVYVSETSTEEEMDNGKESHVDSEDSGLFKEGYFLKRQTTLLGKNQVDQEVKEWKQAAEKNLNELTSEYNKGSKKKVSFAIPLGIEMNRKIGTEAQEDDSTILTKSMRSSKMDTADELDMRQNDEFMREVQRALRRKKNPEKLVKRSLQEEYGRQFSKKMSEVCKWAQRELIPPVDSNQKALPGNVNASNTETGAGGDNSSGAVQGIFEQLSQMVLKNKISKNSKAGLTRNKILKRAEEKREKLVELSKQSEVEEDLNDPPAPKNSKVKKVRFLDECNEPGPSKSPSRNMESKIEEFEENDVTIVQDDNQMTVYTEPHDVENKRLNKVEIYLASKTNADSSSTEDVGVDELHTAEGEQYVFDGMAGEFLRCLRTECSEQGKMSRNDKQLLTFLVKKFIERGELSVIDEMLCASVDDCKIKIPPYENVKDREHWFLRQLIRKYIKRGMRSILEDKIAWIYYKLEASKKTSEQRLYPEDTSLKDQEVQSLVKAFVSSGGNSSLNQLVEDLVQERLQGNANMSDEQVAEVRLQIKDMIVARFARMFLEGTLPGSGITESTDATNMDGVGPSKVMEDVSKNQKGIEQFYTKEGFFEVQWKSSGVGEQSPESDESKESSVVFQITKPQTSLKKGIIRRLQDKFWNKQQLVCDTQSTGKLGRFCSSVSKRGISLIGGSRATPKSHLKTKTKQTSSVDDLKKRLREDNVRWLMEQKNKLWEARNKEARSIDKFTMSLPTRMERIIQKRDRLQKELIDQECSKLKDSTTRKNRKI